MVIHLDYPTLEFAAPELSVVIPAYNETRQVAEALDALASYFKTTRIYGEVILVDDGSTDDTASTAESRRDDFVSLRVLRCERHGGAGRAVRLGMLAARGKLRVYVQAANAAELLLLKPLQAMGSNVTPSDVCILSDAPTARLPGGLHNRCRTALDRLTDRIAERALPAGCVDRRRPLRVFTAPAADEIFGRCRLDGWGFDIEVMAIAYALGLTVTSAPVNASSTPRGPRPPRSGGTVGTLIDVGRIRRRIRQTEPLAPPQRVLHL